MTGGFKIFIFSFWLCHVAYGISVPQPGIKPSTPLQQRLRALTTGPPGKSYKDKATDKGKERLLITSPHHFPRTGVQQG